MRKICKRQFKYAILLFSIYDKQNYIFDKIVSQYKTKIWCKKINKKSKQIANNYFDNILGKLKKWGKKNENVYSILVKQKYAWEKRKFYKKILLW